VNIYAYPGNPLAPHVQRFVDQFLQLETTVRAGLSTDIEQFVYVTANLAVRHAGSAEELWTMLQQWRDQMAVAAAEIRFPQAYRDAFAYAAQRYQCLMDALSSHPQSRGQEKKRSRRERSGGTRSKA
jgi:hypothetical protein